MAAPTIASRLRRRFLLVSGDPALADALRAALPAGWSMTVAVELDAVGGFEEILQHRFVLLDLDDPSLDAVGLVEAVRRELMLNVPILCLGGAARHRDAARSARADRFFERAEALERMRQFCAQLGWGG